MIAPEFEPHRPLISAAALHARLDHPQLRVVDCRFALGAPEQAAHDYAAAHLPGAVYAHLDRDLSSPVVAGVTGRHPLPEPESLAQRLGAWGISNQDFVVVYDNQDGSMAASRLWWMLRWLGHENVAVLDGGLSAWRAAGFAVTAETPARPAASFVPHVRERMTVSREQVEANLGSSRMLLLDARAAERFRGEVEPIDKRAGHIPGARSLPLSQLAAGGQLRPKAELQSLFNSALNETAASDTVAYCGSGVTACQLLLAASAAGLDDMRLYPGSWSEWITNPNNAIAVGPQ